MPVGIHLAAIAALLLIVRGRAPAQRSASAEPTPDPSRVCRTPAGQRPGETGCRLTAETPLGPLPDGPLCWHLCTYPTPSAAGAADGHLRRGAGDAPRRPAHPAPDRGAVGLPGDRPVARGALPELTRVPTL